MPDSHGKPGRDVFFPWSKAIETGIRVIDMDHRSLVDVVNQMHAKWMDGHFEQAVPGLMGSLLDYCTEHFFREEKIMEEYGYPDLRMHKERHRGIRRFVFALRVVATEHPHRIDPQKTLNFLQDWLVNHIGKSDMDYVGHIRERMSEEGVGLDQPLFDEVLPSEIVTMKLRMPPDDALLIRQVAEVLRGRRAGAMELERTVQDILNRNLFEIPAEECEAMVHDLLR